MKADWDLKYQTGYFAEVKGGTLVHVVNETGKPVCGTAIGLNKVFQWCANGVVRNYVECTKCIKLIDRAPIKISS